MARWLQTTVQGMLNAELLDTSIPVIDAEFSKMGDPRYLRTEKIAARGEELTLTWFDLGDPLSDPHPAQGAAPDRPYGVAGAGAGARQRLARNGVEAAGRSWQREREGRPFSTSALAFSESWTDLAQVSSSSPSNCGLHAEPLAASPRCAIAVWF